MRSEIWLVTDSKLFGGIESHLLQLAIGLKEAKVNVRLVLLCEYKPCSPLYAKCKQANVPVNYVHQLSNGQNGFKALIDAVQTHGPDLLHSHGYKASLYCKVIKLLTRTPHINTYHAGESPKGRVWFYDCLDRLTLFASSTSFAVSKPIQDKLYGRSVRFNNFVHCPPYRYIEKDQIAFVGRLSHEKAPDRFVNIAKQLPNLDFHCYGTGPMEPAIRDKAPSNLVLHGHIENVSDIWRQTKVLVIPSRFEGLPMVALEAMSHGCIVLATPVGDLPMLIDDSQHGFIAPWSQFSSRLKAISMMPKSDLLALQQSAYARIVKHYSRAAVIPQIIESYLEALRQPDSQIENQ